MKLYNELAEWWHLLSAPGDYAEEAGLYWEIIRRYKTDVARALELGSGGGNNAFHLKKHCRWTLTDLSPHMIEISRRLNPECGHQVADMRKLRLDQRFDLVFIHDAIMYLTTEPDLQRVFKVARDHLKDDGILLVVPDFFAETFRPQTSHGGHDGSHRSIRYLEWTYDPDPNDTVVATEYAYLLKDETGNVRVEHDRALNGLFPQNTWKELLEKAGFKVDFEPIEHSELEPDSYLGIVGAKKKR